MAEQKCEVVFQPMGITVKVGEKTTLLQAVALADLPLESLCNGTGVCNKCVVKASGSLTQPTATEREKLGSKLEEGWRMACQARTLGDVQVILKEKNQFNTVEAGKVRQYPFKPLIKELDPQKFASMEHPFGVAIDLGTTSIVASLIDLSQDGKEVGTASCLNPQTRYGGDVITRITYAHQGKAELEGIKDAVIGGFNSLISQLCQEHKVAKHDICHITVAGNTTMLHLLVGIDPISLAVAPYDAVFVDSQTLQPDRLGITEAPEAIVSLLPNLSAFIGADILAGLIAIDFHLVKQQASLFIDIGTNGEIVANVGGKLAATSSAAGPALEGMNIHCGCRAEDGAISAVSISPDGELHIEKIGNAPTVKGICGSGLVELVSELVKAGVIVPSGKYAKPQNMLEPLAQRMTVYEEQPAFILDASSNTILTQKDIRQVQLAKAAIAAAVQILFQRLEVDLESVEKVYIAGAFGYHLKPEALKTIGLLPPGLVGEIEFVGNTAKEGAKLCLTSSIANEEIEKMQKRLNPLELSFAPEFMNTYVEHMGFPEPQPEVLAPVSGTGK